MEPYEADHGFDLARRKTGMREWTVEQTAVLDGAGVPDNTRAWFNTYGTAPAQVAISTEGAARASGYWTELVLTPTAFRLRVWRQPTVTIPMQGETVRLHPSMLPGGNLAPEGTPHFEAVIDAQENNDEMGVRLAAAYWTWAALDAQRSRRNTDAAG